MIPVQIRSLVKRYGEVYALNDVSVDIAGGELFFLLGPSGCGKTTLLRSIAGFVTPDAGRIRLGEQDITDAPPNQRDTAMVFQNYALWPHMTVEENVAFGLEVQNVARRERKQRVHEALALVQMEGLAARKPNQLSGGQQQRVALARALVVKPKCLLLDEPLSNLDAKLRLHMRRVIRKLCKQLNLTTIYVTHDQKEALSMADRIAVLRDGRIVQIGTPVELYNRPANQFVAEFVGETNFIPAKMVGCKDGVCLLESPAGTIRGVTVAGQTPAVGAKVTVSVRPEAIRFGCGTADNGRQGDKEKRRQGATTADKETRRHGGTEQRQETAEVRGQGAPDSNDAAMVPVNRVEGTMVDAVYLGEVAQYEVRIAGDIVVKVMQQNPRAEPPAAGQKVTLGFDPAEAVVLTE